jgi:2,3-bisphosphoglycerate-dependent phosphoglycerate mutase
VKQRLFILVLLNLFLCVPLFAQQSATTVILVRHAEKATTSGDDPQLSQQGAARAELLVKMFEHSGLTAIYSSEFIRTKKTVEPLARKLGLQVHIVPAESTKKLVDTIAARHTGGTVLVVGHSNTLPEIIAALGAGKIAEIGDDDYDNLYIVTLTGKGKGKTMRMRFFSGPAEIVCQ